MLFRSVVVVGVVGVVGVLMVVLVVVIGVVVSCLFKRVFYGGSFHLCMHVMIGRSEERRVGKECRCRWSP